MKTMTAIVSVDRQAAIRAGRDSYGFTVVPVKPADLTPEQRETLAGLPLRRDGTDEHADLTSPPDWRTSGVHPVDATTLQRAHWPTLASVDGGTVAAMLDAYRATRAAYAEAVEREIQTFLAAPDSELLDYGPPRCEVRRVSARVAADPRTSERLAALRALADRRNAEVRRAAEERKAAREAEQAAREVRRNAQIGAWVATHGTDGQRRRYAAGLLAVREAEQGMASTVFATLSARFTEFQPLRLVDRSDVKITEAEAEDVTDAAFKAFAAVRDAVLAEHPTATVELRTQRTFWIDYGYEENEHTALFANVEITVGEFTFRRRFACPR